MSQEVNVTLHIAGNEYVLKAKTPESEQAMRLAAEEINRSLDKYNAVYPDKSLADKLVFVTLNQTANKILYQRRLAKLGESVKALKEDTDAYLNRIDKE